MPIRSAIAPANGDATMSPRKNAPYIAPIARPRSARGATAAMCALIAGSAAMPTQYRIELRIAHSQRSITTRVSAPIVPEVPLAMMIRRRPRRSATKPAGRTSRPPTMFPTPNTSPICDGSAPSDCRYSGWIGPMSPKPSPQMSWTRTRIRTSRGRLRRPTLASRSLRRAAHAPRPPRLGTPRRLRPRELADRTRPATGPRDLARGPRDRSTEALDRVGRHAGGQARQADRGLRLAIRAEDRAADAHDALGRLLLIDRVAPAPDRGELELEAGERRDRVPGARLEHGGRGVQAIDLIVRQEREHRLAEGCAVRGQAAADVRHHVRLAQRAARVLALDVHDVGVIEHRHLRREAGPARQLAHRRAADLAHRELVQVRVAELRDAEIQPPPVSVRGRRDEPAVLEDL